MHLTHDLSAGVPLSLDFAGSIKAALMVTILSCHSN